jgi:hypothetical protein
VDHFALFQAAAHHPPTQALFTESLYGVQLLASPPFPDALSAPCPLCCMSFSVSCLLSSFVLFFCRAGSLCPGSYAVYHKCSYGDTRTSYSLTCWSASSKQVWSWHLAVQESSSFLSVTWRGEALYRLRVQGVRVLLHLVFFCKVSPASQQNYFFNIPSFF